MNNFFEKALALRNRYYDDAVKLRLELWGPDYNTAVVTNPCEDYKIEILCQLVATYVQYGENIPDKFSIKLYRVFNTDYLLTTLQKMFDDLSIERKIDSISHVHSLSIYNQYSSAYAYEITLAK